MIGGAFKWMVGGLAVAGATLLVGFVAFANATARVPSEDARVSQADGIVVLTGASSRIQSALQLLERGHGRRLLISGVNRKTRARDLKNLSASGIEIFRCCVDLGYEARNTRENATEIGAWARQQGFEKLIVVTSNYHMTRALSEISYELPGVQLFPHAVTSELFDEKPWWRNARALRLLSLEYVKYLSAEAEFAIRGVVASLGGSALTGQGAAASPESSQAASPKSSGNP